MTNDELWIDFDMDGAKFTKLASFEKLLTFWESSFLVPPTILSATDKKDKLISGFSDPAIAKALDRGKYAVQLYDSVEGNYSITILQSPRRTTVGFALKPSIHGVLTIEKIKTFFIANILLCNPMYSRIHLQKNAKFLHDKYYMKKEISFFFSGFHYMDYLSNEYAEKIIGRDKLFNNPFLTHKEALSDGILLQVGNTPYDCLTPEGEALLVKATEALY